MKNTLIRTTRESADFYACGDVARLVFQDEDGDWWASFDGCENDLVTYSGVWCVGDWWEVVEED